MSQRSSGGSWQQSWCALIMLGLAVGVFGLGSRSPAGSADVQAELIQTIEQGGGGAVQAALDGGVDLNAKGPSNCTPLHAADKNAPAAVFELLLSHGADPNARDDDGRTPLHLANSMSAEILLKHKADVKILNSQGNTVLHTAAEQQGRASACWSSTP